MCLAHDNKSHRLYGQPSPYCNTLLSSDLSSPATPVVKTNSQPISNARGQTLPVIQGESLGGGSSINAMLYTRGAAGDFDRWAQLAYPSWDYKSMEPYFVKSESTLTHRSVWHGTSGPVINQLSYLPFKSQAQVQRAATSMGFENVTDFNSPNTPVDSCALFDTTIDRKSCRVSSFTAYLPSSLAHARRSRLTICPRALVSRIEIDDGVAVGVVFESSDGSVAGQFYARCRKEIVVACGAIASPQLLLLSGIGPREHVEAHGIDCVVDLAGVGSGLQDHAGLPIMYEVPIADTMHHMVASILQGILEFAKYMLGFKSVIGTTPSPMAIFAHSTHIHSQTSRVVIPPGPHVVNRPDIEIITIASSTFIHPPPSTIGIISFLLALLHPKSSGSVRLKSADPHARPEIELGFLKHAEDVEVLRKAAKLTMRLAAEVAENGYPMKKYEVPASDSSDDLDDFIRTKLATFYHYTSTCKMGKRENGGVVDDELKVYGVKGLRVCDASVFPCITTAHTMAPVMAVAERCADIISGQK
ncbi:alcohol oxidase [Mycena amicta]|nr:alcohol oxidase [Mycena amicta]